MSPSRTSSAGSNSPTQYTPSHHDGDGGSDTESISSGRSSQDSDDDESYKHFYQLVCLLHTLPTRTFANTLSMQKPSPQPYHNLPTPVTPEETKRMMEYLRNEREIKQLEAQAARLKLQGKAMALRIMALELQKAEESLASAHTDIAEAQCHLREKGLDMWMY